jgi:hypothetical protein
VEHARIKAGKCQSVQPFAAGGVVASELRSNATSHGRYRVKPRGFAPIEGHLPMGLEMEQNPRPKMDVDEKRRAELLARYKASGLSQREYAKREGLDYNTIGALLWQEQRLTMAPFPVAAQRPAPANGRLEVTLPGKIVVRGDDPSEIARLVQALKDANKLAS